MNFTHISTVRGSDFKGHNGKDHFPIMLKPSVNYTWFALSFFFDLNALFVQQVLPSLAATVTINIKASIIIYFPRREQKHASVSSAYFSLTPFGGCYVSSWCFSSLR